MGPCILSSANSRVSFTIRVALHRFKISVYLHKAVVCDEDGAWNDSDPYANVEISFNGEKEVKKSKVVDGDNAPTFNQWIEFKSLYLVDSLSEKFRLKFSLYDDDDYFNFDDDFLGKIEYDWFLKPTHKDFPDQYLGGAPCSRSSANSRVSFSLKIEEAGTLPY